jgi:hypothetical protein
MNAEFFALAFLSALNPKLLAIDLLLIENRWPRAMFLCLLLGGMTVALTVGLDFLLIIIPFAFLELRPEATRARLKRTQDWLLSHALQLMATIALLLGAYLTVSALVRLS